MEKEKLSLLFEKFSERECLNRSPLYYQLSKAIAIDKDLLDIAAHAAPRQPMPNLFLAAVHYLLLKNPEEGLAKYYPSIHPQATTIIPFGLFKTFCLAHKSHIINLLQTRIVQTNALNRCAYLMPIIFSLFENRTAINLIDIGTSAGLNLNFDQYAYRYNNGQKLGDSEVEIVSEIRTGNLPKFKPQININNKIGIDQNPLDLKIADNALWLKALIWADQKARFQRMKNAIEIAQNTKMELIKGQNITDFEKVIRAQGTNQPLVVYHTHVLYQFPQTERIDFWRMLDQIGKERDFYYLAVEGSSILAHNYDKKGILVELTNYKNGMKTNRLIAITNGHANWINWLE